MDRKRRGGGVPYLTLAGSLAAVAVFCFGEPAFRFLRWEAGAVEAGQLWRVFSGHFTHASFSHLFLDTAAFLVLGSFVERRGRAYFAGIALGTVLLSSLFLEWSDRFSVYCGLSGLGMGMFCGAAALLVREGRARRDWMCLLVGRGAWGLALFKLLGELFGGGPLFLGGELGDFQVAVEAHLAGVVSASIWRMVFLRGPVASGFRLGRCDARA